MFKKLFAVCLLVDDIKSSTEFYKNILKLELNSESDGFVDFKLGETSLAIFQKSNAVDMFSQKYMNGSGNSVYGFQVTNISKTLKDLEDKGVKIIEKIKTTEWGQTVAYFLDPDGHIWEISQA